MHACADLRMLIESNERIPCREVTTRRHPPVSLLLGPRAGQRRIVCHGVGMKKFKGEGKVRGTRSPLPSNPMSLTSTKGKDLSNLLVVAKSVCMYIHRGWGVTPLCREEGRCWCAEISWTLLQYDMPRETSVSLTQRFLLISFLNQDDDDCRLDRHDPSPFPQQNSWEFEGGEKKIVGDKYLSLHAKYHLVPFAMWIDVGLRLRYRNANILTSPAKTQSNRIALVQ